MSKNDMLGTIVRKLVNLPVETHGVVIDLLTKFEDPEWRAATKRFLRKENPWADKCWERVDDNTLRVNLCASPMIPFPGAAVEWNGGAGRCMVQRRGNDLYVDGKKVVLHLVEGQKTGDMRGHELRKQLQGQQTLHPNVLDALLENQHLIPESWKRDEEGRTRYIFFWAAGCCDSIGRMYVRSLYSCDGMWCSPNYNVVHYWHDTCPAAVISAS